MPRHVPDGGHRLHVVLSKDNWAILQLYVRSSPIRRSAAETIDMLLARFIEQHVRPRVDVGLPADLGQDWAAVKEAAAFVADQLELA